MLDTEETQRTEAKSLPFYYLAEKTKMETSTLYDFFSQQACTLLWHFLNLIFLEHCLSTFGCTDILGRVTICPKELSCML